MEEIGGLISEIYSSAIFNRLASKPNENVKHFYNECLRNNWKNMPLDSVLSIKVNLKRKLNASSGGLSRRLTYITKEIDKYLQNKSFEVDSIFSLRF